MMPSVFPVYVQLLSFSLSPKECTGEVQFDIAESEKVIFPVSKKHKWLLLEINLQ